MATSAADWWLITVTDTEALALSPQLQRAWEERVIALVAATRALPEDCAVFTTSKPWEKADYYFTPAAALLLADFLKAHGGARCAAPSSQGLSLLMGNDSAWDLLEGGRPRFP